MYPALPSLSPPPCPPLPVPLHARQLRTEQEAEEGRRDREMVAALSLREEALSAEEKRLQEKAK